jgi:hypothetical protein
MVALTFNLRRYMKHVDDACATAFFEKCAAHDATWESDWQFRNEGHHTPNWRQCVVCEDRWCAYCTPDRAIDASLQKHRHYSGHFECPDCINGVNADRKLYFVLSHSGMSISGPW